MRRVLSIQGNLPGQFRRPMRRFAAYSSRVHFSGTLPYANYRTVLQVSSLHINAAGLPACRELLKPLPMPAPDLEEDA